MTDQTPIEASPQPPDDQELSLLRAQLQALAELALSAPGQADLALSEEVALLRGQLGSLAALIQPQSPTPAVASEEALLLKGLLEALLPSLQAPSDAPTVAPPPAAAPVSPDLARVEAAMARLLQDLAQETSRRVQAEAEAIRARTLLRSHGYEDRPTPGRAPAPPRP